MLRAALVLLMATASAAAAAPVQLAVGSGRGTPGGLVTIAVSVDPADQTAIGAGNDIEYSPLTPIRVRPDGGLDCIANPALSPILPPTFSCLSSPPGPCTRLRALIFRPVGGGTLSAGAFYSCTFLIDPAAAPGTSYPLRILAVRATGAAGRVIAASGTSGAIEVLAPTATPTASFTLVPTATPTASPSTTPTASATGTVTLTRTATRTSTPTLTPRTPVPTATATATPAVVLHGGDVVAAPGMNARLTIEVTDRTERVSGITLDLLLPFAVTDSREVAPGCTLAPRLTAHALSAAPVGDPPVAPELRRLRLVVSEQTVPAQVLGDGPLLTCVAPLREDAPAGVYPLTLDRLFAADVDGNLLLGVRGVSGALTVDPAAPSPTPSATLTASATAAALATRTASPSPAPPTVTPSANPSASPSPTPPPSSTPAPSATAAASCAGDCDGDGAVAIDELVLAIGIASGTTPIASCPAIDANRDDAITIDEIVGAVAAALNGCG